MATLRSRITRLQPSSPGVRAEPDSLGTRVTIPTAQAGRPSLRFKEPEDARLTGGTRSLNRRLLALNLAGSLAKSAPHKSTAASEPVRIGPASDEQAPPLHAAVA